MLLPLLIFVFGLFAVLAIVPLVNRRRRAASAILTGYLGGGAIAWWLVPSRWQLSFWKTLAASVDAHTYGHPIEHYAQGVVVMILCACLAGAILTGSFTVVAARLRKGPHSA